MPSHGLIRRFPDLFAIEAEWRWSGDHYRRTALHWLANYDPNAATIAESCGRSMAPMADLAPPLATILPRHRGPVWQPAGEVWGVSHYRLTPKLDH